MMNEFSRNRVLAALARLLEETRSDIIAANELDVATCPAGDAVILDRLKVDAAKVDAMAASVRSVLDAADPVGSVISACSRPNGLRLENRRVPFGTILIIYEARPDVSIEAAAIALKAGNNILLKGGREARNTNLFLAGLWSRALKENGADEKRVRYLDLSREETRELVQGGREKFDLIIPRGGTELIDFVRTNASVPVIVSGRGNNFLYIDKEAEADVAAALISDGKTRLSVCNALDKVLVDRRLPGISDLVPKLSRMLTENGIEVFGDEFMTGVAPDIRPLPGPSIWYEEFLAAKIVFGAVDDAADAINKINKYSGGHSAAIATSNAETAEIFMREVDSAAVYHNASVRFTDGGQFGLGAEIAVSTQKLHFRGPLGAEHLMTNKWFVFGDGQVRG